MATRKGKAARGERQAAGTDQATVLYVHGVGDQPPPEKLKREWDLALFGREMGDSTGMAYWADVLKTTRAAGPARAARDITTGVDVGALLRRAGVPANSSAARNLANALLRTMGVPVPDARAAGARGVRTKVLPLPPFLRKPLARKFLEAFVADTAAYFFQPGSRAKIQKRFRDLLPAAGDQDPITVVAHSHGSIIALEVLAAAANRAGLRINLITIGSPLGIREVQDFLSAKLEVPGVVRKWHNFADPLDPVALDKTLANDFKPNPKGTRVADELVKNTRGSRQAEFNPHSSVGYLAHPRVRVVVYSAAGLDLHSPFLVARDVAADLANEGRNPVLIEILEPGYPALGEDPKETRRHEVSVERGPLDLAHRIERAAKGIEAIVGKDHLTAACVDQLRRFVAAKLTPAELSEIAKNHRSLRIYRVWKNSTKSKLLKRSTRVIQADAARASYGALGRGILWAVLDTGVRHDHPHFETHKTIEKIWDCTKPGPPKEIPNFRDRDGHGTHVSGIIAGAGKDGRNDLVEGIAPLAKLVVYRVLDSAGEGEDAWIIKALDHIAKQNENSAEIVIHGVNLSLGGSFDSTVYGCGFSPVCAELRRLWRGGVLVCVASGNEGQVTVNTPDGELELNSPMSIGDPANLEECIAVGSVHADKPQLYGVSPFSSRGPTSDGRMKPDVVAPGDSIRSCNSRFRARQKLYREESGTSMAAPHVSGLLAAFLSVRKEFRGRPDEVKELLLRTCTDIKRDKYHQGHGIPNLMRMLLEV